VFVRTARVISRGEAENPTPRSTEIDQWRPLWLRRVEPQLPGCGLCAQIGLLRYKEQMENDLVAKLGVHLDTLANAIDQLSFRLEATQVVLRQLYPDFQQEYERAMDQVRDSDDLTQPPSSQPLSQGHQVARLIADLASGKR